MPSDANGNYSLPAGYLATTGGTIVVSEHNPPLEDVASALTERLMKSGAAAMTGPLKLPNGSAAAPSQTFANATNTGFYKTTNGIGVAIGGVQVGEFTAAGFGFVGEIKLYGGSTAPSGWQFCRGASLLIASYPALYAVIGTAFGTADATHFSLPNLLDRFPVGAGSTYALAAGGGEATHTLLATEMPVHAHSITQNPHDHAVTGGIGGSTINSTLQFIGGGVSTGVGPATIDVVPANADITINNAGSGAAHNNLPPYLGINFIIFTGVA